MEGSDRGLYAGLSAGGGRNRPGHAGEDFVAAHGLAVLERENGGRILQARGPEKTQRLALEDGRARFGPAFVRLSRRQRREARDGGSQRGDRPRSRFGPGVVGARNAAPAARRRSAAPQRSQPGGEAR